MSNPLPNKKQAIVSQKDLNFLLRIVKANWWVPLIIIPLFYAMGAFYIYRLTPIYSASTEFLLKTEDAYYKNNVLSDAAFYSSSFIDNSNETRIVKSYDLTSKVVNKLRDELQVSYFIVGKVRTVEYFSGMPFKVHVNTVAPQLYEKQFDFRITDYNSFRIEYEQDGKMKSKDGKFEEPYADTDISFMVSRLPNFSEKSVNTFRDIFYQFSIHSDDNLISNIQNNLQVENPQYTQILKVSLSDVIPERAVLILDTLNSVYAESKLKLKYELNERTISYIEKQLNEITFSLRNIEDTMQNYKEKRSIINLEWEQTDFLTKISAYDGQKSKLQMELAALNDLEKYIIENRDPQFLPPSIFVTEKSGFMNTAAMDLYQKQIELGKLKGSLKDINPVIADLQTSIESTKQALLVYIGNTRKASMNQMREIEKEMYDYIRQARLLPGKQRDVLNIQRLANVNEQLYNFLLEKRASTKIARASIVPDLKIVEAPRNIGIGWPQTDVIQKQFISIGLVLSALVILLRSLFFTKIKTVDHLKDLTELPLAGVVPQLKDSGTGSIVVEAEPNSLIAEAFRNIRTNLQYANVGHDARTFLITSFLPGEGKTFTSVNLATVLAKSGKRTVIIELDLHKPGVYKRFNMQSPAVGLTTYVTGNSTLEEIISPSYIPNLSCIFAGPVPPNPSDFVLSEKMSALIRIVKEQFDYVIIDTPPAGLLSDSIFLIQHVDASLFVLNTKSSTKRVVSFIEEVIAANNLRNVMLVLNGVKRLGRRYYYQGYGYSYGYGYGYGYRSGKGYRK